MRTRFTELLGIEHPLVGFNRSPGVVAAVSNGGGLGVFAATAYRPEELDVQLTWIEQQTGGRPYGVDLLVPVGTTAGVDLAGRMRAQIPDEHTAFVRQLLARYDIDASGVGEGGGDEGAGDATAEALGPEGMAALLDVIFAHPVALVANALGPPPPEMVERGHAAGAVVASLVGKAEHAVRQMAAGVDVLIAQGTEAGGHTGEVATMVLTPEVVELAGDVPVIAAGGIASGAQMAAALALGADGVWCGSVWLNSVEDITPDVVKQKFVVASSADTVRSRSRTGKPARQLRSPWHDAWDAPDAPAPLPMQQQVVLAKDAWARIDAAAAKGHRGAEELESFFIGQVVGRFGELRPTGDIVSSMVRECKARLRALGRLADS